MTPTRVLPLIGLLLIWLIGGLYYIHNHCCIDIQGTSSQQQDTLGATSAGSTAVVLGEDDDAPLFSYSSHQLNQPLSVSFSKEIDDYLERLISDGSHVKITGFYGHKENNKSIFPNLGLARANNLKKLFLDRNIDGSRIHIDGKKMNSTDPSIVSTLNLAVVDPLPKESLTEYKVQFEHNPIIIYFKSGTDDLILSDDQRESLQDLSQFMSLDRDLQVDLSCHETSANSREKNNTLSKEKGQIVWNKLKESGLDVSRINVIAYGQDRVIAATDTPEGMAKNNRIEISVD